MAKIRKVRELDPSKIKYVIYCRKSTDEKGKQEQSIFSQLLSCKRYADSNGYAIAATPDNDDTFFCKDELQKEMDQFGDSANDLMQLLPYFVVIERETAHKPNVRKKWRKLMKMAKLGQIDGILSYAPDRHARNMLEAGELVDALDNGHLDVKYVTFHFQNTTDGKMMLAMLFSFAKHYSDQRSDLTDRGFETAIKRGQSLGQTKRGYFVNADGFFEPHPKYFPMMRAAFEMKIYGKSPNKKIADFLKQEGFKICRKVGKRNEEYGKKLYIEQETDLTTISEVRKDAFYYGIYIYGDHQSDQRDTNTYYQAMITEDERGVLQEIVLPEYRLSADRSPKDENIECYPFPQSMVVNEEGEVLNSGIPNKKRHQAALERLQIKRSDAILADVIQPHHVHYRVSRKKKNGKAPQRTSITADVLIAKVQELLKRFSITEEYYQIYVTQAQKQLKISHNRTSQKASEIGLRLAAVEKKRKTFIYDCLPSLKVVGTIERDLYEEKIKQYDANIDELKRQRSENEKIQRNEPLEIVAFLDLMRDLSAAYEQSNYVRKAKVAQILFSNIVVNHKKQVTIRVKDVFKPLFGGMVGDIGLEPTTSTMSM